MHQWGDRGVDWQGISDAAEWIAIQLRHWGRIQVTDQKEKWGEARVYCHLGWYQLLHSAIWLGYHYRRGPQWLWWVDRQTMPLCALLNRLVIPLQRRWYSYVYGQAIRRWPHLRREILAGADWPEYLTRHGIYMVRTGTNSTRTVIDEWSPLDPPARRDIHGKS